MRRSQRFLATILAAAGLFVAACGGVPSGPGAAVPPATGVVVTAVPTTAAPAARASTSTAAVTTSPASSPAAATSPTPAASATTPTAAGPGGAPGATPSVASNTGRQSASQVVKYNVVADGTKAGFRVREQLAQRDLPSDAVGTTTAVTGGIALDSDGRVVPDQSKFVVDLSSLQSDSAMRDRFIQGRTMETSQYPEATFVPTAVTGLPLPLPTSGQQSFKLTGNLTVHGVTKPVTFSVTAQANGSDVTGQATTSFKFEDFGMTPPKAGPVLSVVDNVTLEVNLHLSKNS